jgi:TolB protein
VRRASLLLAAALAACSHAAEESAPCALDSTGAHWIAFASARSGDYEIVISRSDGTCMTAVTTDPSTDLSPTWADHRIAFASDRGGRPSVWIHDLTTGVESRLDTGDVAAAIPAFSPDGAWIAFEGRAAGSPSVDVYVIPAIGGTPIALTSSAADDTAPAWSPDGSTVYFVSTRTGAYELFSMPAAGGTAVQQTTGSRIIGKPAVAPDGTALYFARRAAGSSATEVVRFELATKAIVVVSDRDESEPALSPDGTRLALRSFRFEDGNADLVLVDAADGGNPIRLTTDPASEGAPAFAPDPLR